MNDARTVWERYVSAWNTPDHVRKRQIFAECLAPGCVYTDPLQRAESPSELEQYMVAFHDQLPGARFETHYFLAHHQRSIARWKMMRGDVVLGEGISYGEYDAQQQLVAITGFFEATSTELAT